VGYSVALFIVVLLLVVFVPYLRGRREHRVIALGRETYVRWYPNPGVCLRLKKRRVALSVIGGLEVFESHPQIVWRRTYAKWSRVKRPGGKV